MVQLLHGALMEETQAVASELSSGVSTIYSTSHAFAALKEDGSVVTWGTNGGDSSSVATELSSGIGTIYSTIYAFAALKEDGSVVTWGSDSYGGDSSIVASELSSGIGSIYSTNNAFAALSGDSDNDGVSDWFDIFPNDPTETADTDADGVGDNEDAFPNDPTETADTDGDGVGDNEDAFPNDPSETADSDGDGVGDNEDAFPNDPSETADSDGDGVGDNEDAFPNDPSQVAFQISPILSQLKGFYESTSGINIGIDATPTDGYPAYYTYQWYFNGFTIPSMFGGTNSIYTIDGSASSNGTWRVEVTNDAGTASSEFEYRVFTDADTDGLSDYRESNILNTNPNLSDTDNDGLSDYEELSLC